VSSFSSDSSFEESFDFQSNSFSKSVIASRRIIDSSPEITPTRQTTAPSSVSSYIDESASLEAITDSLNLTNLGPTTPPPPTDTSTTLSQPDTDPNWSLQSRPSHAYPYYALTASIETSPFLPSPLYNKLFSHQRCGIAWIHDVHNINSDEGYQGGILGDDMGLGKTYQSASYILGMFYRDFVETQAGLDWCAADAGECYEYIECCIFLLSKSPSTLKPPPSPLPDQTHNSLIVAPTTLLPVWRKVRMDKRRNKTRMMPC
jgi:SNF2 family DNA or RNA helicase